MHVGKLLECEVDEAILLQPNRIVAEHREASIIREIREHEIAGFNFAGQD
jgi:hypothetical protein